MVGPETVIAPAGWEGRLVEVVVPAVSRSSGAVTAWCLEVHDLVLAKLAAGRPHDMDFVHEAIRAGLVETGQLMIGIDLMPASHREVTRERLLGAIAQAAPRPRSREEHE